MLDFSEYKEEIIKQIKKYKNDEQLLDTALGAILQSIYLQGRKDMAKYIRNYLDMEIQG